MRVAIDKATLKRNRACRAAYTSPEWNESEQALVYSDWAQTIKRLLSSPGGTDQLEWLVTHKLVPMTAEEFAEIKATRGGANV